MLTVTAILTSLLCLASIAVWFFVFWRLLRGVPVVEFLGERTSNPHVAVFGVTLLMAFMMLGLASSQTAPADTDDASAKLDALESKPIDVELAESTTSESLSSELPSAEPPSSNTESASESAADSTSDTSLSDESSTENVEAIERSTATGEKPQARPIPQVSDELLTVFGVFVTLVIATVMWLVVSVTTPTLDGWGIRTDDLSGQVKVGALGALAAIVPTLLIGQLTHHLGEEQAVIRMLRESESIVLWISIAVSAVVAAPLMEEIVFRVVIQGYLTARFRPEPGIAWAAMLFAAVHGWPAMVGLMPFALIIGYLYFQTRSVLTTITMHMVFNGSMLFILMLELSANKAS